MYFTTIFGSLAFMSAVLGFLGLGYGTMPELRTVSYVFLIITTISFVLERRMKKKKHHN